MITGTPVTLLSLRLFAGCTKRCVKDLLIARSSSSSRIYMNLIKRLYVWQSTTKFPQLKLCSQCWCCFQFKSCLFIACSLSPRTADYQNILEHAVGRIPKDLSVWKQHEKTKMQKIAGSWSAAPVGLQWCGKIVPSLNRQDDDGKSDCTINLRWNKQTIHVFHYDKLKNSELPNICTVMKHSIILVRDCSQLTIPTNLVLIHLSCSLD